MSKKEIEKLPKIEFKGFNPNGVFVKGTEKKIDDIKEVGSYFLIVRNIEDSGLPPMSFGDVALRFFEAQLVVTSLKTRNNKGDEDRLGQILTVNSSVNGIPSTYSRMWVEGDDGGMWLPWQLQATGDISIVAPSNELGEKISLLESYFETEVSRAKDAEAELGNKLIKLAGFGTISAGNTGVTAVGECFVSTYNQKLYRCTKYNSPTSMSVEEVSYQDGSVYTYDNELYVYDGVKLVSVMKGLYNTRSLKDTNITLADNPARLNAKELKSEGFGGYRYDLSNAYAEGCRAIRFRGSNYTLANDIVRGLIVDVNGNVESVIETISEKSNGWEELPVTPNSSYLLASYTKASPNLYGELFEPEYVELVQREGIVADVESRVSLIEKRVTYETVNMLNPHNLLFGYSLSSGQIVAKDKGVFSNKLFLEIGRTYTIKDVPLFSHLELVNDAAAVFIAKYDALDVYLGRDSVKPSALPTDGYTTITYTPADDSAVYYRVLLQSGENKNYPYDASRAMIYEGEYEINEFIPYGDILLSEYDRIQDARIASLESKNADTPATKNNGILLTGASFAYNGNTWFSKVCEKQNLRDYNKAVSGESIRHTAVKMHNGTLYSKAEFENFDTLLIMHVHNQDVCDDIDLQENYSDYEVSTSMSYSQAYDYVLKKYAAECYAAKDNPESKWYGTQCGKPCKVVCMTHWHDSRTVFNDSIRRLRDKWGFGLIELDKNIGFSKNSVHPVTGGQVSVIHAQDTEVIDGVTYGWHPSRATDAYIQDRIAEIVVKQLSI